MAHDFHRKVNCHCRAAESVKEVELNRAAILIVQPETVLRWHRRGFRAYWHWRSRNAGGRFRIDPELRALIRHMSRENPLWGAPRIHGELRMLGIEVAESTVGRYMVRTRRPPSQGWRTFLSNHVAGITSLDLFVVRTLSFKLLYGLVILRHARRRIVSIAVTTNPTAQSPGMRRQAGLRIFGYSKSMRSKPFPVLLVPMLSLSD